MTKEAIKQRIAQLASEARSEMIYQNSRGSVERCYADADRKYMQIRELEKLLVNIK
jgi:hypothetical protein